jgi:hypothetical protein
MPGAAGSKGTARANGATLSGSVKSVDRERGRLTLETASGTTQLTVPPSALGAPAATPGGNHSHDRTGSSKNTNR